MYVRPVVPTLKVGPKLRNTKAQQQKGNRPKIENQEKKRRNRSPYKRHQLIHQVKRKQKNQISN
jgi:hypothetical protein